MRNVHSCPSVSAFCRENWMTKRRKGKRRVEWTSALTRVDCGRTRGRDTCGRELIPCIYNVAISDLNISGETNIFLLTSRNNSEPSAGSRSVSWFTKRSGERICIYSRAIYVLQWSAESALCRFGDLRRDKLAKTWRSRREYTEITLDISMDV